jgi:hypothetical protein
MRFTRRAARSGIAAAAALASIIAIPAPAANATNFSINARCGFEESGSRAYYYNCVSKRILIRIDIYGHSSSNDLCLWTEPWERRDIGDATDTLNAYALGSGICNI